MRFYVEGCEVDVQDPTFFMDDAQYNALNEILTDMLSDYGQDL